MNQQQRNYIKRRVTNILNDKTAEARKKFTNKAVYLSNEERLDLIFDGKVEMRSKKDILSRNRYGNPPLTTVFDFSDYEDKGGLQQQAYSDHCKKLNNKANEIIDKVMLGDAEEAIRMIKDFEDFEG